VKVIVELTVVASYKKSPAEAGLKVVTLVGNRAMAKTRMPHPTPAIQ
jgi:hypothetical protein